MTTKGKAVKSVIYISSSDEDEEDTPPPKARLPYKVKKENVSNGIVKKTETVILSSDDELEKTGRRRLRRYRVHLLSKKSEICKCLPRRLKTKPVLGKV